MEGVLYYTAARHKSDIFCELCASFAFLAVKIFTAKDAKKNVRLLPGEGIYYQLGQIGRFRSQSRNL